MCRVARFIMEGTVFEGLIRFHMGDGCDRLVPPREAWLSDLTSSERSVTTWQTECMTETRRSAYEYLGVSRKFVGMETHCWIILVVDF